MVQLPGPFWCDQIVDPVDASMATIQPVFVVTNRRSRVPLDVETPCW